MGTAEPTTQRGKLLPQCHLVPGKQTARRFCRVETQGGGKARSSPGLARAAGKSQMRAKNGF